MSKEEIKAYQEKILDDLLNVFDELIGEEQQIRSEILEHCNGKRGDAWWSQNGRVDGVDTGRALVERYFASLEATDE